MTAWLVINNFNMVNFMAPEMVVLFNSIQMDEKGRIMMHWWGEA